jgi:hypothetical protein
MSECPAYADDTESQTGLAGRFEIAVTPEQGQLGG